MLTRVPDPWPTDPYEIGDDGIPNFFAGIEVYNFEAMAQLGDTRSEFGNELQVSIGDYVENLTGLGMDLTEGASTIAHVVADFGLGDAEIFIIERDYDVETIEAQLSGGGYDQTTIATRSYWRGPEQESVAFFDGGIAFGRDYLVNDFVLTDVGAAGSLYVKYPQYTNVVDTLNPDALLASVRYETRRPPTAEQIRPDTDGMVQYDDLYYIAHASDAGRAEIDYMDDDLEEFDEGD